MYHNPFTPGYEVLSKSGYSIDSHGSLSNTAAYLITNDFPNYAGMFYSPTDHEVFSQIKYGNFEQDYSNLREIQKSLNGPQLELYIPESFVSADGVGRQDNIVIAHEKIRDGLMSKIQQEALKEIENAQKQVKSRRIKIEIEDILFLRRKKTIIMENFEGRQEDI